MTFWHDNARVELLRQLWDEGLSASQIAGRIGGCTRNAVISKVHRLGLSGRSSSANRHLSRPGGRNSARTMRAANNNKPATLTSATTFNAPRIPAIDPEPYEPNFVEIDVPVHERKKLVDLEANDCRWPIGDPRHDDFHFCNGSKLPGMSYCAIHARVAYQPSTPSERRRSNAHVERVAKREAVDA